MGNIADVPRPGGTGFLVCDTQCNKVDTCQHYGGRCNLHFDNPELCHEGKTSTEQGNKKPRTGTMSQWTAEDH